MKNIEKMKYGKDEYLKIENIIFSNPKYKIITTAWLIFAAVFFMCNIVLIMQGLSDRTQQYHEKINENKTSNNLVSENEKDNNGATAAEIEHYTVFFDVKCEENFFFNKDDIEVFVDDAKIGRVPHGFEFTKFLNLSEGDHIVKFVSSSTNQRAIHVDKKATLKCDITVDFSKLDINEFSFTNGISTNEEILESIPGTYYGFGESGLVLLEDYSAEYCMDYYNNVGTGGSWYYKEGKLYITLTKPQCKIYADVRDKMGSQKISIVTDNPFTWGDEDFIKISDESKPLSVEEYKVVIKKGQELRKVADVVSSINSIGEVTLDSGDSIRDSRKSFEELDDTIKGQVYNLDLLEKSEAEYKTLKIKEVENAIELIGEVSLDRGDTIKQARNLYNLLDDEGKTRVNNYKLLENAEEAYRILEKDEVEKAISDIGVVTLESSSKINDVRKLYDKKSDDVKNLISNYDVLVRSEKELSELKIQKVSQMCDEINATEITINDYDMVESAMDELNKLTTEEKQRVKNSSVIIEALDRIDELKEEVRKPRTMAETKLQAVVDASKEYGVTEVYDEFFGHATRRKQLSDSSGGLMINIIYYTENNEIMCADIITTKAVPSKTQRKFVKGIAKYVCPASDASSISSWVNANVGNSAEKQLNGFTYELSVGPVDNILFSAGEREWEKWELKQQE